MRTKTKAKSFTPAFLKKIANRTPKTSEEFWDKAVPGFGIKIGPRRKSWIITHRRPKDPVTGKWPAGTIWPFARFEFLTYEEARTRALEYKEAIREGFDPKIAQALEIEDRKADAEMTFAAVRERFAEKRRQDVFRKTGVLPDQTEDIRALKMEHFQPWEDLPIAALTTAHARGLLSKREKNTPGAYNKDVAHLSSMFTFAVQKGYVTENIAKGKLTRIPAHKKTRFLNENEIEAFWKCRPLGHAFGDLTKFLLITGQRLGHASKSTWQEFDLEKAEWRAKESNIKLNRRHILPLPALALNVLAHRPQGAPDAYVFARKSGNRFKKPSRDVDRIRAAADFEDHWTLHDLRRTQDTTLCERLDITMEVRNAIQDHGKIGIEAVYNQATYMRRKQEALNLWGWWLSEVIEGRRPDYPAIERKRYEFDLGKPDLRMVGAGAG